jgi:dethiobiotin synthetase
MGRACFVSATDTEVGKTILAATLIAGLRAQGLRVAARKPVITGVSERPSPAGTPLGELADDELLAALSGEPAEKVAIARFTLPASPHLAAAQEGATIDCEQILAALRAEALRADVLIVEGIGGLLVPLRTGWDVRRLAAELGWPVLIAARPGLGTINHTLLTLEAARSATLDVRAVVFTPWPAQPDEIARSNRDTVERLGGVEVATLERLPAISRAGLEAAAATLGYERWLEPRDQSS